MYIKFSRATVTNTPIIFDVRISRVGAETSEYIFVLFVGKPLECRQNSENLKRYNFFCQKIWSQRLGSSSAAKPMQRTLDHGNPKSKFVKIFEEKIMVMDEWLNSSYMYCVPPAINIKTSWIIFYAHLRLYVLGMHINLGKIF